LAVSPWRTPFSTELDRGGNPRLDANGKPIFNQIIDFRDRATADKFNALVLALVRAAHPDALDNESRR
jgi:hypothetical protein